MYYKQFLKLAVYELEHFNNKTFHALTFGDLYDNLQCLKWMNEWMNSCNGLIVNSFCAQVFFRYERFLIVWKWIEKKPYSPLNFVSISNYKRKKK